ncbi:MAG TPA: ABC transporter substrate-binding protein [Devosiaceae bacterium]|jgi:peptide/nickel transport system substrate-binding protein
MFKKFLLAGVLAMAMTTLPVAARDLTIGVREATSSIDPHYYSRSPDGIVSFNIFESLISGDASNQLAPRLAVSWQPISDTVWEFKLRQGVKFHDGSDFTADDVVASIERASHSQGPVTYLRRVAAIDKVEVVDPYTVRFHTKGPWPLLPRDLAAIRIIPAEMQNATREQFDNGEAAIGTGPYKFVRYTPQDIVEFARNDDYWGTKPDFEHLFLKTIPDAAAREAALRSGDLDLIEEPSPANIANLKSDPNLKVVTAISGYVIYVGYDQINEPSPGIEGTNGRNPMLDKRVRQAISKAIDRQLLVDRVLLGLGAPASQPLPPGNFGHADNVKVEAYDPEGAKKLLAEAGYPNGFTTQLTVPSGELANAANVGQAMAAMLQRVGITVKLNIVPDAVFGTEAREHKYSLFMSSYISPEADGSSAVRALTSIPDKDKGWGTSNYGGYGNQASVDLLTQSFNVVDPAAREKLLQQNIEMVLGDYAIAPLYWQAANWAFRKDIDFAGRSDANTYAEFVSIAK